MTTNPEDRIIEECSELIKAIMKAKRFGWDKFHPSRPDSNNLDEVLEEMVDVEEAIEFFRYWLPTSGGRDEVDDRD